MADAKRLNIRHVTTYRYDTPVHYALQQLRLTPRNGNGQTVLEWNCTFTGGTSQVVFDDHFLNHTELVKVDQNATEVQIQCEGVVEVEDNAGVIGKHRGYAPLWLFMQDSVLTQPGPAITELATRIKTYQQDVDDIALLHALSAEITKAVVYEIGSTTSDTQAEDALAAGRGVCQDHAQIMISTARLLGFPARYVSGYLLMDDRIDQDATHAWCEVYTKDLGWVGFDVSNGISPDARYVRIATGRDYRDSAPILGIRQGDGIENLQVALQVQQ
ncbi:transglutaminase family protein [Cognatishimia sp. WU-CL00825]|uniref:transglutaminase family protein n=1 Tax=Cognatishimia sp. WU-CL00825 TaxID=3127658 RepID=UPI00310A09CD